MAEHFLRMCESLASIPCITHAQSREEIKLGLSIYHRRRYHPLEATKKIPQTQNDFSKFTAYNANVGKPVVFLYINNEHLRYKF